MFFFKINSLIELTKCFASLFNASSGVILLMFVIFDFDAYLFQRRSSNRKMKCFHPK